MKSTLTLSIVSLLTFSSVMSESQPFSQMNADISDVQNRCIVRLDNAIDHDQVTGIANALSRRAGSTIKHIYKHSIRGFTINLPCSAAGKAFGRDGNVISLTPDSIMQISKGKPVKGGEDSVTPPQQVSYGTTKVGGAKDGTGLTAWVIDTGIDLDHPDLNVDASRGFTLFNSKGRPNMDDENGHGTHVAGTIGAKDNLIGSLGVAANATVVPVRVLDRRGSGSTSGVIAGIDYVAANAVQGDCANMSLGGGTSQVLDDAVLSASNSKGGIYFVLAAGNSGADANNHSPARANGPNVWTISAVDANDDMPSWSNRGNPPVDYAAPGVSIFSLWKNGGTNTISGTSMAAPHACAVIMLSNGNPGQFGYADDDTNYPIIHL